MAVLTPSEFAATPANRLIRFLVVVPTRGQPERLEPLLNALASQSFPRERWTLAIAFDGAAPTAELKSRLEAMGAIVAVAPERHGPGAARNLAVRSASEVTPVDHGFLAFTEDDCVPAPGWLAAAAARLEREPSLDVLEGATLLPDGAPARRRDGDRPTWLPTNLFVRRELFERVGGYCEEFFDPRAGIYFREDSDFGFTLREAGARVACDPAPRVTHPREHAAWLDPIRWARRYEMDPLLRARHPLAFREEIEVMRFGPFLLRRPFVRACAGYAVSLGVALAALLVKEAGVAAWFGCVAMALLLVIWSKWRFEPARIPLVPIVPFVLLLALARGRSRATRRAPGARPASA